MLKLVYKRLHPYVPKPSVTTIPEAISSKNLPKPIWKWVYRNLRQQQRESPTGETSEQVLQITDSTTSTPLSHASSSSSADASSSALIPSSGPASTRPIPRYEIPNPFLRQRTERDVDNPYPHINRKVYMYTTQFPQRLQKKMIQRYPIYVLPPSVMNPLEKPPIIRWEDKLFKGAEITWSGEWKPEDYGKPKGMFSNRARMFKGHRRERERDERKAEVKFRMETMEARVEKWREEKKVAKVGKRPALPF